MFPPWHPLVCSQGMGAERMIVDVSDRHVVSSLGVPLSLLSEYYHYLGKEERGNGQFFLEFLFNRRQLGSHRYSISLFIYLVVSMGHGKRNGEDLNLPPKDIDRLDPLLQLQRVTLV